MFNNINTFNNFQDEKIKIESRYSEINKYAPAAEYAVGKIGTQGADFFASEDSNFQASSISGMNPVDLVDVGTTLKEFTGLSVNGFNLYSEAKLKETSESFKRQIEEDLKIITEEISLAKSQNENEKVKDLENKKEIFQEQIHELKKISEGQTEEITERKKEIGKDFALIALSTVKEVGQTASEHYDETVDLAEELAMEIVGVGAEEILAVVGVIRKSSEIKETLSSLKALQKELSDVRQELESAKQNGNTIEEKILELRLKHLETKIQDETFKVAKTVVALVGSLAGTAVSIKAVLLAVGIAVGATLGTAAAVTGIAAAVIAAVVIIAGLGFVAYKKRHTIAYGMHKASLESKKYLLGKSSSYSANQATNAATQLLTSANQVADKSETRLKITHKPFMQEAQILLDEIEELKKSKVDFEVQSSDNYLTAGYKKLQASMIDQKISFKSSALTGLIMKTTEKALTIDSEVKNLKGLQEKLKVEIEKRNEEKDKTDEKIEKVATVISQIDDEYTYGEHVAKFSSNPQDESMTSSELRRINGLIIEEINKDPKIGLLAVKELFTKQEQRTEGRTDLTFFIREEQIEEDEKGRFFKALVSAITA